MSDDESDYDSTDTDWLANSTHGYGFGYTKEQALLAMFGHVEGNIDEPVTVDLVEHVGSATVRPSSWRVENYVDGERVTIDVETASELRDLGISAVVEPEKALDTAEREEIDVN